MVPDLSLIIRFIESILIFSLTITIIRKIFDVSILEIFLDIGLFIFIGISLIFLIWCINTITKHRKR